MKKLLMRKTAALMAMLMTVSLLVPVLAFAASHFSTPKVSNGQIAGSVYVDSSTYGAITVDGATYIDVYLFDSVGNNVYNADGTKATVRATYTYTDSVSGMSYFDYTVSSAAYSTYGSLNIKYYDAFDGSTAETGVTNRNYTTGVIGGGGGGISNGTDIVVGDNGVVNADLLKNALADGTATIAISGKVALLPASALTADGVVTIVAKGGSYELPLNELNLAELAKELGVELKDLTIAVTIEELTGDAKASAEAAVKAAGGKVIGGIIDFKVEAVAGDKNVEVKDFSKFIKRTIKLTGTADNAVAVRITGNEVASVPTMVYSTEAALFSKSNSVYTVINVEAKTFADLVGHWSQDEVEALASKLIVEGTGANKFEPKRAITRAEFAAMIVRALGLEANGSTDKFSDVASSAWYAGAVAAAADAGIVQGDAAGTFRPSAVITRQELAAMVVRAMKVAGKEVKLTDAEVSAALAPFADAGKLGWAKAEVAAAVSAGIIEGQSATSVAPLANANRGEASAMVLRLLTNVGFIN
jgi:N-acetylmuramoyl-L-alanine amidase